MIFENILFFINTRAPRLLDWIFRWPLARRGMSRYVFRKAGTSTAPRPHPYSMACPYTTWRSLTDRRYTGRHLGECADDPALPPLPQVADLFLRKEQTLSVRSSMLFAAFAQWFTDSFLRTEHGIIFGPDGNPEIDATRNFRRRPDRHRFNTSNHEIDLCQIYGLGEEQTSLLRTLGEGGRKGCLKSQDIKGEEYPAYLLTAPSPALQPLQINDEFKGLHDEPLIRAVFGQAATQPARHGAMFAVGLEHGNSTLGNSLMNTIFLREHNRVAGMIAAESPGGDDERVFQTARNTMIVVLLKIVISDYIRHITPYNIPLELIPGLADTQRWYRSNRISMEFNLLYRWHQLIPDKPGFLTNLGEYRNNNPLLIQHGVRQLVRELSLEPAGRIGLQNTAVDLQPVEMDTLNLMRASRLAPYNEYRKRFGLEPAKDFEELTGDPGLAKLLHQVYGGEIDRLEWYVGIFAERHANDGIMGNLLTRMVAWDAFTQALTNPLLANGIFNETTFSKAGWQIIAETSSLEDVLARQWGKGPLVCSFNVKRAKEQLAGLPPQAPPVEATGDPAGAA